MLAGRKVPAKREVQAERRKAQAEREVPAERRVQAESKALAERRVLAGKGSRAKSEALAERKVQKRKRIPAASEVPAEREVQAERKAPAESEAPAKSEAPVESEAPAKNEVPVESEALAGSEAVAANEVPAENEVLAEDGAQAEREVQAADAALAADEVQAEGDVAAATVDDVAAAAVTVVETEEIEGTDQTEEKVVKVEAKSPDQVTGIVQSVALWCLLRRIRVSNVEQPRKKVEVVTETKAHLAPRTWGLEAGKVVIGEAIGYAVLATRIISRGGRIASNAERRNPMVMVGEREAAVAAEVVVVGIATDARH